MVATCFGDTDGRSETSVTSARRRPDLSVQLGLLIAPECATDA